MPREKKTPAPKQKRGKTTTKAPRSTRRSTSPPLTPAEQAFADKLKPCLPQERLFVRHRLAGRSQKEAAKLAGYSEKSAEDMGAQLSGRLRVSEAYQAGLAAAGFGPQDVLADIQRLRTFDRSQIETEVHEIGTVVVERRAEDVIQEIITKERAVSDFLDELDVDDEEIVEDLKGRQRELLRERLELQMLVAVKGPDATTLVHEPRTVTKRVIDYDKARELGLLKFIKNVRPTKYGDIIETYDWMDGVQMAAKSAGLFVERRELSGPGGAPIQSELDLSKLSAAELAERYNRMLEEDDS